MNIIPVFLNFLISTTYMIIYPQGVLEYEKLWNKLKSNSNFQRIYLKNYKPSTKFKFITLGVKTAKTLKNEKNTVIECFIPYKPVVSNHQIIPYRVQPQIWSNLFKSIFKQSEIMLISTSNSSNYIQKLHKISQKNGLSTKIKQITNQSQILKYLAFLKKNKSNIKVLYFPLDISVITPSVIKVALKIQNTKGIAIIVRTKYEVLNGGILTIEPYYTSLIIQKYLQNFKQKKLPFKIYFNPLIAEKLGIKKQLQKIKAIPLSR